MDAVTIFLLAVAAIFLIGTVGEIVFQRTSVPDVIWLILAGIVIGPIGGFVSREQLGAVAPFFAAITLVIVLFEGGSSLKLGELREAAARSVVLGSTVLGLVGFVMAVLLVACATMLAAWAGWLPSTWTWTHGLLAGAILGGTSAVVFTPAIAKAELPAPLASLLKLESAIGEALSVVTTAALVDVLTRGSEGPAAAVLRSFGIGLGLGIVAGAFWLLFLRFLKANEHAYPITLAALLFLYVLIERLGGSPAVGILVVAMILGNAESLSVRIGLAEAAALDSNVRGYHRQMAFMIKSFFFVFIGAMLGPPWAVLLLGLVLGVALLGTRAPLVYLTTQGGALGEAERKLALVTLPRGMAAGVLATLPVTAGVPGTENLPVMVFACVLMTVAIFSVGFPVLQGELRAGKPAARPPATHPPAIEPPATQPPATQPPATQPPATQPPATQPPATQPPATQPPATAAPTSAPATSAPATSAPATSAPATSAPATSAPATSAPATPAPATQPSVSRETPPPPLPDLDIPGLEASPRDRERP